jgi:general nucleoside transport system ATP-binding protein
MPILQMINISKYFPGIKANEDINFILEKGEIHSILGENGAGKSTLMNILSGFYYPDSGKILLNGKEVRIHSPKNALDLGIGMVHQHFHLSERHSVFENIILGSKKTGFIPDVKKLSLEINRISEKYDFDLNPEDKVWKLSVSEQQKVEILKIIFANPDILVFDEPTAVLTSIESEKFFNILKKLKNSGYSIIFISHKLDEVLRISDRITILSKGRLIDTLGSDKTTKEELAEKMIGRKIVFTISKPPLNFEDTILSIKQVNALNSRGLQAVSSLDLDIKKGEIFGIAGVSGNGQVELSEALFGLRKMEFSEYRFNNINISHPTPKLMMNLGMKLIPADRKLTGTAIGMNIPENFILNRSGNENFSRKFLLKTRNINDEADNSITKYRIQHQGLKNPVSGLSGGNLQKIIVAREVESLPEFLIAVYPTRGLDIGAIESLHNIMIEEQNKGSTILLISEDLDEIFNLADRIGVIYKGKIIKIAGRDIVKLNEISLAMGGSV